MSTMEHLFMQIFDRKQWIERQLEHQVESYGESLAYNILAEAKQPPPWLWTTGVGGCSYPDPKGLNTEQLISRMPFSLPKTTTPSANNSTCLTLPAFVGSKVCPSICPSNKFMETCASNKYIFTEDRYKVVPSASKLNPDMIAESKVVEACAELDPFARTQHLDSRQKDQEIRLCEQEKGTNHLGEMSAKEGYTCRLTRSRAVPVTDDNIRESSATNDSLHHHNTDGGRMTRSRSKSAVQTDCLQSLDKLSEPLKPTNCVKTGVSKGAEIQSETQPVNLNHLSCTSTGNVRVSHTCITESAAMELGLETASHVNSGLKMSSDVAPFMPDIFPLVEPEKLLFDDIKEHGLNKNCCISSEKKNQFGSENSCAHREVVQPVNKRGCRRDLEKVDGSEKDVLQHRMEIDVRVSNYGTEQDILQLLESEDSENHSHPPLGHQSSQQDVYRKSSTGSLADKQHSITVKEVLTMGLNYGPHPACGSYRKSGLNIDSDAVLEEAKGSSSDIAFNKLKVSQLGKEASSGGPFPAHVFSVNSQLQDDVLPDVEVACEAEEANTVSGQVLKDRLELSEALESESISLSGSNNNHSGIHATSYLKIRSGISESNATCSSPDADFGCNSDLDFLNHQIAIPDGSKKSSLRAPILCPIEEKNREKLIKQTSSRPIQLNNIVQSDGSSITTRKDEVVKSETASIGVVKSILHSSVRPTKSRIHDRILEFHHCLRNSSINGYENLGYCKLNGSALPTFDNADVCLLAQSMYNESAMGMKELSNAKTSGTARTHSTQPKVPHSLRSSTSLIENLGYCLTNGSISCSEENSMLPETNKNESSCPEDATEKPFNHNWITPNSTETQGASTKARYFLRSRSSYDRNVPSSRSSESSYAGCLKQAKETSAHACEISWPKRRKVGYRSNNILATSPRLRFKHSQCIKEGSDCSCKIETGSSVEFQPISISAETETGLLNTVLETPSKSLHQSKKYSTIKGCFYLKGESHSMLNTLTSKYIQEELRSDITDRELQSCVEDETNISETTISKLQKHYNSENCHDSRNSEKFSKDREPCDTQMSSYMHDTCSSLHSNAGPVCFESFDETMPEFEGFNIVFSSTLEDDTISNHSNLPTLAKERASMLEKLCKSKNVLTPVSCTSSKYKIHKVLDVYQSLPAGLLEQMNLSSVHFNDADMERFGESDNGNLGSQFDGSFVGRPYSYSMPSSTRVDHEARKPPLTPPVLKFGQTVVSGRSSASSEVGSNPELICFRIDENSCIADENGHADELDAAKEDISFRKSKELTNRKALGDITAEYQNEPILVSQSTKFLDRGGLESVNSESYLRTQMNAHSCLAKGYAVNMESKIPDKENIDLTVNKKLVRKAALSLRNRSSKPRMSGKINERSRSYGNLEKGCKPSNMVSNISSFVPLVRQKQQAAAPLKGRKEIKVKALEAAEVAKRLEEQKQNEREMRKAAAKLEREKAEQENIRRLELMQKQKEEERKKKEADVAARKRQREEEGRKEKERKRRCMEGTRRQKREQEEKTRAEKVEKKLQHKASGVNEREKELVEEAKEQLQSGKSGEVQCQRGAELQPNIIKVLTVEDRNDSNILEAPEFSQKSNDIQKMVIKSDGLREVLQTRISVNEESQNLSSYEMSPYKDSDDEDGEQEIRREKKCIPLWARRECLDQIILSKQHADPAKIFCKKHSFILSEVLSTRIRLRPI